MTARTARSSASDSSAFRRASFIGTVSALSASGRSRVSVATAPSISTLSPSVTAGTPRGSSAELDETAVDDLEEPSIDRFISAAGLLDHELAEHRGKTGIVGSKWRGRQQMSLRDADQDATMRAELALQVVECLGKDDPGGIHAIAGIRADESPITLGLVGPGSCGGPFAQVRDRGRLQLGRFDAPRQQVIAVDEDVEPTGRHRVDDRDPRRSLVEQRLGMALHRMLRERLPVDGLERKAGRTDRTEGRA